MKPVPSNAWACPVCDVRSLEREDIVSHIETAHGPRALRTELGLPWEWAQGQLWAPDASGNPRLVTSTELFAAAKFLNKAYPIIDRIIENAPADEQEHILLRRYMDEVFPR